MINVGIVGASGYAGEELNNILSRHKNVKITSLTARRSHPLTEGSLRLRGTSTKPNSRIKAFNLEDVLDVCDLFFFALPHTESMKFVPYVLEAKKKVIDLGADYRLKNISEYEHWYETKHLDKKNINISVYGLPELYREKIKKADLIANPGCYPTAAILALLPLVKKKIIELEPIVIDAKSGVSGAGRKCVEGGLVEELKENFKPYNVNHHQHMPEIDQELSLLSGEKIAVDFVPHLLPIFRGILSTIYIKAKDGASLSEDKLIDLYKTFYKHEPFVRILNEGKIPQIKDVAGTNFCDIAIFFKKENNMIVVISTIDNLVKGAAGQAVQNMNLIYGFKETEGLIN